MKTSVLLFTAALLATPTAFAADDLCELKLNQLENARESRDISDELDDQLDALKDQAEEHEDAKRIDECAAAVDQAMKLLETAPVSAD
jgi:flagellar motility protein MotE (MotC chaperone)